MNPLNHLPPVVLAEDDPDDQWILSDAWRELSVPTPLVVVPDGEHLLHYIQKVPPYAQAQTPCLILMDWFMPKMDGYELLRRIHQNPATQRVPIVVMSGALDMDFPEKLGVEYLKKALDPEYLTIYLNSLYHRYCMRVETVKGESSTHY